MSQPAKVGTIWAVEAVVQVIDGERWHSVGSCSYTPRAINDCLVALGLRSAWIRWTCGRELWFAGSQIAHQSQGGSA